MLRAPDSEYTAVGGTGMGPTDAPNPYEAPRAELDAAPATGALSPSLQDAIAGRYDFTVSDVMDEAWRLVKGMKASFWGAAIVIGLIYLVVSTLASLILTVFLHSPANTIVKQIFNSVVGVLMTPFTMGLHMMCVRRALGLPVSFGTAFSYFPRAGTAMVGALGVLILGYLGLLLLVLPGIYLLIAYSLTTQLICDRELPAWDAMETSRRAIKHKWWSVFGLGLLVGLMVVVSALGLLIPLIWTIPWAMMTSGVLYKRIFYYAAPPAAEGPAPAAAGPAPASPVPTV
jgi:hypothetical protein